MGNPLGELALLLKREKDRQSYRKMKKGLKRETDAEKNRKAK